jgi:hypothetical protein
MVLSCGKGSKTSNLSFGWSRPRLKDSEGKGQDL